MVLLILPQSKEQVFQTCFVERYYYSQQLLTSLPELEGDGSQSFGETALGQFHGDWKAELL